jgi:hypothetical protein
MLAGNIPYGYSDDELDYNLQQDLSVTILAEDELSFNEDYHFSFIDYDVENEGFINDNVHVASEYGSFNSYVDMLSYISRVEDSLKSYNNVLTILRSIQYEQ